jgi:hypothetical protein
LKNKSKGDLLFAVAKKAERRQKEGTEAQRGKKQEQ